MHQLILLSLVNIYWFVIQLIKLWKIGQPSHLAWSLSFKIEIAFSSDTFICSCSHHNHLYIALWSLSPISRKSLACFTLTRYTWMLYIILFSVMQSFSRSIMWQGHEVEVIWIKGKMYVEYLHEEILPAWSQPRWEVEEVSCPLSWSTIE